MTLRQWRIGFGGLLAVLVCGSVHATPPKSGPAADYLQALVNFEPWAESVWKEYPAIPDTGYFGDGASDGNGGIRGTAGIALAYAVLVKEFPDSPDRARRLKHVEETLRYCELTHSSGPEGAAAVNGKKWGVFEKSKKFDAHGWQSPLWTATMATAAFLVEKDIDPKVIEGCKRVVAAEADVLAAIPPANGYIGDTKCEENAWDTSITALAASWMPDDQRAKLWMETAKKYLANTYTVPDYQSDPLKEWITTQTLYPSYALENHGFYHPMYQIDGGNSMGDTFIMSTLVNPNVGKELTPFCEHNVLPVWDFLDGIVLDTGETAYPSGVDWSLHAFEHSNYFAYLATHFHQPVAEWAGPRLAKNILARQAVNGDGEFVGESCPNGFYREAVNARSIALAYLHNELAGFPVEAGTPPADELKNYPDAGLIFERTKDRLVTISYGAKTMSLVYPLNGTSLSQQFFTSPNTDSLLGGIERKKGNRPVGDKDKTTVTDFTPTADGFSVTLHLHRKAGSSSTMFVQSVPGAVVYAEVPAGTTKSLDGDWYLMAVENHKFTGGQRTVLSNGVSKTIKERSGEKAATSDGWMNIDNWMGVVTPGDGEIHYQAPTKYNRDGAAEDSITFKQSGPVNGRVAIVLSEANAETTAAVRKSLQFSASDGKLKVSFTRPDGKPFAMDETIKD